MPKPTYASSSKTSEENSRIQTLTRPAFDRLPEQPSGSDFRLSVLGLYFRFRSHVRCVLLRGNDPGSLITASEPSKIGPPAMCLPER